MKKYVNTRVLLLFCLCALLLAGAAVTYAWYRPIKLNFAPAKVDGSIRASYFQSGDGSQAQPFEIAKPEQFYNLAWLQYLGRFNEAGENGDIPTTYFYLSADIDMMGYVLPPVGTEKYPFVGNFDGKGKTVTGLIIAVPTDLPIEEAYEYPQIVGAFGVVGTMGDTKDSITIDGHDYTYSSAANEVKNVTFKELTVETQTANALIGLAAGYVNGKLTNVGIQLDNTLMSKLDIKFNTSPLNAISANLSDHSLVGYTKDVETDTSNTVKHYQPTAAQGTFTAKGETGDDETTGGGSLELNNLYTRVADIYGESGEVSIGATKYRVFGADDNKNPNFVKGSFSFYASSLGSPYFYLYGKSGDTLIDTYIPLKVKGGDGADKYYVDETNNTGYLTSGTTSSQQGNTRILKHNFTTYISDGLFDTWKENLGDAAIIEQPGGNELRTKENFQNALSGFKENLGTNQDSVYSVRFYGGDITKTITANNVRIGTSTYETYELPEACIDFRLSGGGFCSFFASTHSTSTYRFFKLYEIVRGADNAITSRKEISKIYGRGSDGKYRYAYTGEEDPFSGEEPLFDTAILTRANQSSELGGRLASSTIPPKIYYFEIPLNAGEYALGAVDKGAALMYLDIGVDGGAGSTEGLIPAGAEVTRTKTTEVIVTEHRETSAPKGVDFVTTPVTVTQPSVTKATATKRLDGTASGVYEFSTTNGVAACTHDGATETLGLDGTVTTAKRCIVTLTDTWQKDNAPVTRTIRVVYDGTNTTYAVTMNGETNTYTYNDLKDKADITGVGNGPANTAPKLPTPEEMAALQAEGETVLEYTYTAADAVIDSVFVPTATEGTGGTVTVTGGSYTVTSNKALGQKVTKQKDGYTVIYNTAAP